MHLPPHPQAPSSPQLSLELYYSFHHVVYLPEIILYIESYDVLTTLFSGACFSTVSSEMILCIKSYGIFACNHITY